MILSSERKRRRKQKNGVPSLKNQAETPLFAAGMKFLFRHLQVNGFWEITPKSPEPRMNTGVAGIDAKTALQNGRLFLYQSLFFDLVEAGGVEPPSENPSLRLSTGVVYLRKIPALPSRQTGRQSGSLLYIPQVTGSPTERSPLLDAQIRRGPQTWTSRKLIMQRKLKF